MSDRRTEMRGLIRPRVLLPVALLVSAAVALLFLGWIGLYARYAADDYCTAARFADLGFWPAQRYWYRNWSGRYAFYFLINLAETVGPGLVPILPLGAIAAWFGLQLWALVQWLPPRTPGHATLSLAALTALSLVATLYGTADLQQSLFWRTGLLTYTAPLIGVFGLVGLIGRRRNDHQKAELIAVIVCLAITFVLGGTSETWVAAQTAGLACVTILAQAPRPGRLPLASRRRLWAGLAGSCLALLVMALAPGNRARAAQVAPPAGAVEAIRLTLWSFIIFLDHGVRHAGGWLLFTFVTALLLSVVAPAGGAVSRHPVRALLALIAVTFVIVLAAVTPAVVGMGKIAPPRAWIIPQAILTWSTAAAGYLTGRVVAPALESPPPARRWRGIQAIRFGLAFLLVAVPPAAAYTRLGELAQARAYAALWDRRDREIRRTVETGAEQASVTYMESPLGLLPIGPDPQAWTNACAARYYGLDAILAQKK